MSDPEERLVPLAELVSDGAEVDWSAESAARPDEAAVLEQLRVLARVAEVHRTPHDDPPPAAPSEASQSTWGPLRILERIGQGAFADVYRAFDTALEREVALKLLRTDRPLPSLAGARFLEEARKLARVRHTNVVTVHGADRHDGRVGLWMDLVRGRTLEQVLAETGPLGPHEAAMIGIDLCRALAAIHGRGMIHGDVKTANVIREEGGRIVLMDFGAVAEHSGERQPEAMSYGTPAAMSPEQLRGDPPTPAADIYGLGVLLYRLLSGRYPIEAANLRALAAAHERGERRPLRDHRPDLPTGLVQVIERALAPEPSRRFASAGAMEHALAQAVGVAAPRMSETTGRRIWLWVAAVIVIAAAWLVVPRLAPNRSIEPSLPPAERSARESANESATGGATSSEIERARAATTPPAPASPPPELLTAAARLYRSRDGSEAPLAPGDPVAPGDALFLEVRSAHDFHAYVLDEDSHGNVFVLFPTRSLDAVNPLRANVLHRLPGTRAGRPFHWQVTSAGGREAILVLVSRSPLAVLEREIAAFPSAEIGARVAYGAVSEPALTSLRGIGGMVESQDPGAATPRRLSEVLRMFPRDGKRDVWVWQIDLASGP